MVRAVNINLRMNIFWNGYYCLEIFFWYVFMTPSKTKQIMDAESINRSIARLAHEILEHNNGPDNIILIGK